MTGRELTIFADSHGERLLIERGRAVGVQIVKDGQSQKIFATDEVIVCAGAIDSPALLLRSGIGPTDHLNSCGIDCEMHAPEVGMNLQDHLVWPVVFQMHAPSGLPDRFCKAERDAYRQHGTGPMASNIAEAGAMLGSNALGTAKASSTPGPTDEPVVQIHTTATHYLKYPVLRSEAPCASIAITALHPQSRGTIRLDTSCPQRGPVIDPAYLECETDLKPFLLAYEWVTEMARQSAWCEVAHTQVLPSPKRNQRESLVRSIRTLSQSIYHPVGTCRAGADEQSVVDSQLRVRGILGLRIADVSVLPDLPSGNTCSAAWLVAELAALSILKD